MVVNGHDKIPLPTDWIGKKIGCVGIYACETLQWGGGGAYGLRFDEVMVLGPWCRITDKLLSRTVQQLLLLLTDCVPDMVHSVVSYDMKLPRG